MNQHVKRKTDAPIALSRLSTEERHVREQLAALYRICHRFGWTELIYNHVTARVPGRHRPLSTAVLERTAHQGRSAVAKAFDERSGYGQDAFDALVRQLDAEGSTFRQ